MGKLVAMSKTGRMTLPATARRRLGIEGEMEFEVEVEDGNLVLKPAVVLPLEDAWAYTAEHRALLDRAHADSREGRVKELTADELTDLADN